MPIDCGHCGRQGTLETKETVELSARTQTVGGGPFEQELETKQLAQVDRCSVCGELTLSRYWWNDTYFDAADVRVEVLYPATPALADLPPEIAERYTAMLQLQGEPDVFAVRAGRLVEAVCTEQGVSGDSEREQINALAEHAGVPRRLVSQAHLVYTHRNYGGHIKEFEVEADDVPLLRGFIDGLLDHLYREPARLERASAAFTEREAAAIAKQVEGASERE